MKRYLQFYDSGNNDSLIKALKNTFDRGASNVLVIGIQTCSQTIADAILKAGLLYTEKSSTDLIKDDIKKNDVILVLNEDCEVASSILHLCISIDVMVIAPITEHHYSKRTIFLMSIPKSGTHMVIRLFSFMGLERSPDRTPSPGTWCTPVSYEYHTPCKELLVNDAFDPQGRQLLFRSPAIFVYRNPLDIIVSELDWFTKTENSFSGYLNCFSDESEKLEKLISDDSVQNNIRNRINRYTGWMNFNNVIPISYEEIVGERGGGNDDEQLDVIWSLQLKLHIPGEAKEYASQLYDPNSATFSRGQIGRHKEKFKKKHYKLFNDLPQDFMQNLGYVQGNQLSSKTQELRHRSLVIKNIPTELLYRPRLVREGVYDQNIVEIAGKYLVIPQGIEIKQSTDAEMMFDSDKSYMTLKDAEDAAIYVSLSKNLLAIEEETVGTTLIYEDYFGFNIVSSDNRWYGFAQIAGPLDIGQLSETSLQKMKDEGLCVFGENAIDVKAEILRLISLPNEHQELQLGTRFSKIEETLREIELHLDSNDKVFIKTEQQLEDIRLSLHVEDGLAYEDYFGFAIVCHDSLWYGLAHEVQSIDVSKLEMGALEKLKRDCVCVTGLSLADVKTEILRIVITTQVRKYWGLTAKLKVAKLIKLNNNNKPNKREL